MDFLKKLIGDITTKYGLTNIAGTITGVLAALTFVADRWLGCNIGEILANANAVLAPTCKLPSFIPTSWVPVVLGAVSVIYIASKLMRPGTFLRNLLGGTAVIVPKDSPSAGVNTVTPAQVAAPGREK